jgi:hypothetical protein
MKFQVQHMTFASYKARSDHPASIKIPHRPSRSIKLKGNERDISLISTHSDAGTSLAASVMQVIRKISGRRKRCSLSPLGNDDSNN